MERDTNQRPQRDGPNGFIDPPGTVYYEPDAYGGRIALDYDDRDDTDGHWEDGHWSGAVTCAVVATLCAFTGIESFSAAFTAAAVICACLPRWRRH